MGHIVFSSETYVYISACIPHWNGIIEYSYDNTEWKTWDGDGIVNNVIYMRGVNNTIISNFEAWLLRGENIKCQGNIENLLDYKSVINNVHPHMTDWCFGGMFENCISLIEAPQLLATDVTYYCYINMFWGCTSLVKSPVLLISDLHKGSYENMFYNCSALITSPIFSDLQIAKKAIINQRIFDNCTSLNAINVNNKLYDFNTFKLL